MKIGTMVFLDSPESLEHKFTRLVDFGLDNCQLCSWDPRQWTDENAEAVKQMVEKYKITVSAFWCGWEGPAIWNFYEGHLSLGLVPTEYRQMRVQNLCDGADFAKKLGIQDVVTHMGFIPENTYDQNFAPLCVAIKTVADYLKRNGQNLLFETGQETPVTMMRCFEKVNMDNLGINLDTANLILYGKANPVDALDVFGEFVRDIHAKDGLYPTDGRNLGKETPIGEGKVDFPKFVARLKEIGYDGPLTIEREISGEKQIEDIKSAKAFLETLI
jgi:sugar phosphate isomerase/epimerase